MGAWAVFFSTQAILRIQPRLSSHLIIEVRAGVCDKGSSERHNTAEITKAAKNWQRIVQITVTFCCYGQSGEGD